MTHALFGRDSGGPSARLAVSSFAAPGPPQSLPETPRPGQPGGSASSASSASTDLEDDPAVEVVEMVMEPYFMQASPCGGWVELEGCGLASPAS